MNMDSWDDFFIGMLVAAVAIALVVAVVSGIAYNGTFNAGEAALSEAEVDYMLSESVGNAAVLFATDSGRIVYYDGALFKEME